MKPRGLAWTLASLAFAVLLGAGGCSDDHSHDEGSHSHQPKNPSCAAIMDVCHEADLGPGDAHECHELAATDVEGSCASERTRCVDVCEAILADAG